MSRAALNSADWKKLQELFHRALQLPAAELPKFIDGLDSDSSHLRAELLALIASEREAADEALISVVPIEPLVLAPGSVVEGYEITSSLGAGGMGVVYRAVELSTRRQVALKVMGRGLESSSAIRRFRSEAQILAKLRHPNIAQLYAAGSLRLAPNTCRDRKSVV